MGLGPPVLKLYRQLKALGTFDGVRDVLELARRTFGVRNKSSPHALRHFDPR